MSDINVTGIKLTIDGHDVELTVEQAKDLYRQLRDLLGEPGERWIFQPAPVVIPLLPTYPPNYVDPNRFVQPTFVPWWHPDNPYRITCGSGNIDACGNVTILREAE